MRKNKRTYEVLGNAALPTEQQKGKMLNQILLECRKIDTSPVLKIYRLICIYPWRFAFGLSTLQTLICTMIWGRGYTNMVLKLFGG